MLASRLTLLLCCAASPLVTNARAEGDSAPLHQRIDEMIAAATTDYASIVSAVCSDEEFVRRLYLDLSGRIPSAEQTLAFLQNDHLDKRVQLVNQLLTTPEHARHLQHHLDVLLMERRPKKHIDVAQWRDYLFSSLIQNKTWDVLTREILTADGVAKEERVRVRFLLDRELKAEETTRDLGRVFLGRDLQCAQCHDHPTITDYEQVHYFGLNAFLNRSYLFTDPKSKEKWIGEKAEGTVKFTSVFTSVEAETAPRMLTLPPLVDPSPDKEPYIAKPDKAARGIPKYSRRLLLADAITDPANRAFRLNIANRLWAMMTGRGLVEPLDMFHSDNPPSHPELLDLLADGLVEHSFDMRWLIREIALSQTYQLSSVIKDGTSAPPEKYTSGLLKPLSPEQLSWSVMQACGVVAKSQQQVAAKLAKDEPTLKPDTAEYALRMESLVDKSLSPHVENFVTIFASANESSRFDATANQALFVLNGDLISNWLKPSQGHLTQRLAEHSDTDKMVDEFYLRLLTRRATESDRQMLKDFVQGDAEEQAEAMRQAVRSVLCSAEFRFNH